MVVVKYSEFFENMNKYLSAASSCGLKILPQKKERAKSKSHLRFMRAIEAASGVLPSELDFDKEKTGAILKA